MKEMISERLVQLSGVQESMVKIHKVMDHWDVSQALLEKNAFDAINVSDKVLNLSKEGQNLIARLQESYNCCVTRCPEHAAEISDIMEQLKSVFKNVFSASIKVSEISHDLEHESSHQKEIKDGLGKVIGTVTEGVDAAIACAEFLLAEMVN